ncbi:pentapeptide repeat-containing protein [Spirulina sp. 06S082]|uniref:pentapeptide repeat-containing protein n=1 Tax=Spirulina sp. 06S082 TaxID=3110248 RepID=UPI002B20887D|nr:pentapeptide repeat-containing protein [Spirulina sp. 06S082]MEA5471935.1 pentapeptide repeat-containing protein [Spirulina sp. 06S082]
MKAKELLERYEAGERDFSGVDLSKENLSGAVWTGDGFGDENDYPVGGAILRGINLSHANLTQVRLDGVDLREANLQGANLETALMTFADLSDANLSEAVLFRTSLSRAILKRTNLKKASLRQATIIRANFCDANLEEANLFETNAEYTNFCRANLKNSKLDICELYCADLSGADMRGISLYFSRLDRAVAIAANMTRANLSRTRLREANLTDANLTDSQGAELDDAILYETIVPDGTMMSNERGKTEINRIVESREDFIKRVEKIDLISSEDFRQRYEAGERNFSGCRPRIRNSRFLLDIDLSRTNCIGTDLTDCIITNANLEKINLQRAKFFNCKLINSNLRGANLRDAKLDSASLINVDLTDADLTGADLSYTRFIGANLTNVNLTDIYMGSEFGYTNYEARFAHTIMPDGSMRNDDLAIGAEEFLRRYAEGERDFSGIILHYADLRDVELRKINFRKAYFNYVDLGSANLIDSYFGSAKFIHCNLKKTKFEHIDGNIGRYYDYGCDFSFAYFIYVDMRQSHAVGTVTSTSFIECNFEEANWDCSAEDIVIYHNVILENGEFFSRM